MKKKTLKIIYWIATFLFGAMMLFSGISELMMTEQGNELFINLGYPLYLNYILGIAKILGVIALFVPSFKTLKEWAYAGFTIDLAGASLSFIFSGAGAANAIGPFAFLVLMFVSYFSWRKLRK